MVIPRDRYERVKNGMMAVLFVLASVLSMGLFLQPVHADDGAFAGGDGALVGIRIK